MTNDNGPSETEFRKLCAMLHRHAGHITYSANGNLAPIDVAGAFIATGMQLMLELGDVERAKAYIASLLLALAAEKPPAAPPPAPLTGHAA
jgi:hypothetical protein